MTSYVIAEAESEDSERLYVPFRHPPGSLHLAPRPPLIIRQEYSGLRGKDISGGKTHEGAHLAGKDTNGPFWWERTPRGTFGRTFRFWQDMELLAGKGKFWHEMELLAEKVSFGRKWKLGKLR